jgi:hypothetical protein
MTYKLLTSADGVVSGYVFDDSGEYTEEQAKAAMLCNKVNPTQSDIELATQAQQAEQDAKQYQRDRAFAYPSIPEQLDMQYWDSVNGTTVWQDTINAIKAKYPKVG